MEYAKLDKRVINRPAPAMNFGSAIHLALETRYSVYKNRQPDDALLNLQAAVIEKHFESSPQEDSEDHRNANWAIEVIKKYNEIYHTEPFNILSDPNGKALIELPFALPLFDYVPSQPIEGMSVSGTIPVIYTGRIDLPVMWDKSYWIVDNKTASRLGQSYFDEKQMSAQQLGYCWAFGTLTGLPVQGFCINAIRTSAQPAKPKGGIEEWWRETLQRQRYNVTPQQLTEWKSNTIKLVEEFFYHYEKDFFPQKTAWCGGKYGKCQYFGVCSYPVESRPGILASSEYQDNTWSPLNKTTATTNE
jgi:hypothetical protein